jgi:hypothetical protein
VSVRLRHRAYAPAVRDDEGWRWLRNSSGIVAAVCGLIALPVLTVVAVIVVLVPFTMNGCEYSQIRTPEHLGMSLDGEGAIIARVPSCHRGGARVLRLVGPDQTVIWQAEADEAQELRDFRVGVAPEGFSDTTAYQGPMDATLVYDMQVLSSVPEEPDEEASDETPPTTNPEQLNGGAHTLFRRADLGPDQMFFDGQTVAAAEFDTAACGDRRS